MKWISFSISALVLAALIYALDRPWGAIPALGKLLSPQHGFWQNAESYDKDWSNTYQFNHLNGKVEVLLDERMVPHIFAEHDEDAYFVQGYLHAQFRLWQMEFQIYAASGRLSEILGFGNDSLYLKVDLGMRRLGMVYAAEQALKEMESDPASKLMLDNYTAGFNAYVQHLQWKDLPLEYKLLNYTPEKWTNLKSAIFLKMISYDLTARDNDIEYTNLLKTLGPDMFEKMYPVTSDSLDPIIPKGTFFEKSPIDLSVPAHIHDSTHAWGVLLEKEMTEPHPGNGSNNWAVSGSRTASGKPILCDDPHLGMNLPALWFEIQIKTPQQNVYGVSFPGAPGVIIGFNDSISWGVTNGSRDVRDYYKIHFEDQTRQKYWYNGELRNTTQRPEKITGKNGQVYIDTVDYTHFGPVARQLFQGAKDKVYAEYAVRWKAHDPSNELKAFYMLNRAKNYDEYLTAIRNFKTPVQNFVFASATNDIAIWQQGEYPAKWRRQGDFLMDGKDSTYEWRGMIPETQNPHQKNPARGFVSSANQYPTDTTYPYYLGGDHPPYRGKIINFYLSDMNGVTVEDMMYLQNQNYNYYAELAVPVLINHLNRDYLDEKGWKYFEMIRIWNRKNDPEEKGATIFTIWAKKFRELTYADELAKVPDPKRMPYENIHIEAILKDTNYLFLDDITTEVKEGLSDIVTRAFIETTEVLEKMENENKGSLAWYQYNNASVNHLLKLPVFSYNKLYTGGGVHIINAVSGNHGPSWRMIVHMTDPVEAYGIYPGGQVGNPGSKFYDQFINDWAAGRYYKLLFLKEADGTHPAVKFKQTFSK
ncbi:penicillin acylase family protein [Gynurincola endophyticus]|uniref:penicillin acylase family protein n=1 Tax=Gynurincola endophyticus TaxID=2479004 RepID=UPI000F8D96CE|nr:penicillin acylase family protein [Gynurincola endophyticus]